MMSAYNENYISDAMYNLGEAFDYAANDCGIDLDKFMELFISSGHADAFGRGDPWVVAGVSGSELAMKVLENTQFECKLVKPSPDYEASPEYWSGWVLAYYQWKSMRSFRNIMEFITMSEICRRYHPLHEASEEKFVDVMEGIIRRKHTMTRLQARRKQCGYSQSRLAKEAGVNLRTLQQYELGTKDINKASALSVFALSRALYCKVEDLLEYRVLD